MPALASGTAKRKQRLVWLTAPLSVAVEFRLAGLIPALSGDSQQRKTRVDVSHNALRSGFCRPETNMLHIALITKVCHCCMQLVLSGNQMFQDSNAEWVHQLDQLLSIQVFV